MTDQDYRTAVEWAAECERLRQRIAELEKDAGRYRWLRATADHECSQGSLEDLAWFALRNESPEKLDAEIDAAMLHTSRESNP